MLLIGLPNTGFVRIETCKSLIHLMYELDNSGIDYQLTTPMAEPVHVARNGIVRYMLDETRCDELLFLDSDIEFHPKIYFDLKACEADVAILPVPVGRGGVIYSNLMKDRNVNRLEPLQKEGIIPVDRGGSGLMLIQRHVFEKVDFPWFRWIETRDGYICGEDFDFCDRCKNLGLTIRANTDVDTDHIRIFRLGALK